jgi:hypothetical protein
VWPFDRNPISRSLVPAGTDDLCVPDTAPCYRSTGLEGSMCRTYTPGGVEVVVSSIRCQLWRRNRRTGRSVGCTVVLLCCHRSGARESGDKPLSRSVSRVCIVEPFDHTVAGCRIRPVPRYTVSAGTGPAVTGSVLPSCRPVSALTHSYMCGRTTERMKRRSGLGLSMLLMSFWMGQTALTESGIVSLGMGSLAVTLACIGGGMLSGHFEPEAIPDEKLRPLTSRLLVAMLIVGAGASLLLLVL